MSSQNDNDRFGQSRNVLLEEFTLFAFLKGEQGGRRGPTEDETARDQATPPDSSSLGAKDQSKASGRSGGFEPATDAAADEAS